MYGVKLSLGFLRHARTHLIEVIVRQKLKNFMFIHCAQLFYREIQMNISSDSNNRDAIQHSSLSFIVC